MVNIREVIASRKKKQDFQRVSQESAKARASGTTSVSTTSGSVKTSTKGGLLDIINQQQQGMVDLFTGGGGGGGSSSSSSASAEQEAQRIASERNIALAKARELQRQRAQAQARKEQLARERELELRLRKMSAQQKQQFFRQQQNITRGQALLQLQEQGKKLSPSAQKIAEKEFQRLAKFRRQDKNEFITEKQTGSVNGTPTYKTIIVDRNNKYIRDANASEKKTFLNQLGSVQASRPQFESKSEEKLYDVEIERERLRQKKTRQGGTLSVKDEARLDVLTASSSVLGYLVGLKQLPSSLVSIAKDYKQLKQVPKYLKEEGVKYGKLLRVSPSEAVIKIGVDILLMKGTGKVLKIVGKYGGNAATKLSPKFKKIKNQRITFPSATTGKTVTIKVGGSVKKISESLAKQVALEGKSVTAVSAQADRLLKIIRRKKIIRKPIPNEIKLKAKTKRLLNKFDKGKIKSDELRILIRNVKKETGENLLERSFFADPRGRFRPSRLGGAKTKDASLLDILADDVTFKAQKPQILVFENIKIQKLPKSKIFKTIRKKLKSKNPKFTEQEANALLRFQLKKSGKFKPVGALTKEPEITLAPGEIVKKIKEVGTTIINGKKVSIVQAKVVKATTKTKKLIAKAEKGKATSKELKTLKKNLKKETGFSSKVISRRGSISRARISPSRTGLTALSRVARGKPRGRRKLTARKTRISKRTTTQRRKVTSRQLRNLARARKVLARKRVNRTFKTPRRAPPILKIPRTPVKKTPIRTPKRKQLKKSKRNVPVQTFNVYGKSGKKFVKLNTSPLARNDALSKGTYAIDNTTSRQFKIVPSGKRKTTGAIKKSERNYFNRAGYKLREFKVKKGRKFSLQDRYIEQTKRAIDTRGEKSGLTIAKYLKEQKLGKTTKKRKITPMQRKELLKRLEKARKVLRKKRR